MADNIQIVGLAAFLRDLKQMPDDVQKSFAAEMKAVAEVIAQAAARKVPSKSGDAISSIVSKGTTSGASIAEGGSVAPYMKWLDFGSRTPRIGNSRAEGPWRGSGKGPHSGRFIYPAIKDHEKDIVYSTGKAIDTASRKAGFH